MSTTPVSLGLIGSGWIGRFHAETIAQRIPGAKLEAVADPQPGAAAAVADPLGVEKTFLDAAELLADPAVDGVVISSPAFTHADLVVAAAEAGKAVFVEKPMALTLADADRAIATAEASFSAAYGYDVRGEVFGSEGMVTAGDVRATSARHYTAAGEASATTRLNVDLFHQAYTDELVSFVAAVRSGEVAGARGEDARTALAVALACVESVQQRRPVALAADGSLA